MKITVPEFFRWILMLPAALFVTAVLQVLLFQVSTALLMYVSGLDVNLVVWISKCVMTPFMGAAFVTTFWWLAPSNKNSAAAISLLLVAVWGITLMHSGFSSSFIWVFLMGALGLAGAIAAFIALCKRPVAKLA